VLRAYLHALRRAERYIYLENQYFTEPELARLIAERVKRRPDLQVVVLLPKKAEEFLVGPAIAMRQDQLIRAIDAAAKKRAPRAARVHAFGLSKWNRSSSEYEDVYVHAKVGLIDDEWMTIGSANAGPRSLRFDSELNAFSNDIKRAVAFRRELWSEHLGISKDDDLLKDPGRAIKKMVATSEANAKKTSGELQGRLVPMMFELPALWLRPAYELRPKNSSEARARPHATQRTSKLRIQCGVVAR
jgi:phosphatidylserine/phosphatidylglycerophosphate/cardiolipin synthase-like enzyme